MSAAMVMEAIQLAPVPTFSTRAQFIAGLKFLHGLMRASAPLLELAITKSSGRLRDYYTKQLEEEREHADWLLEDLAGLGEAPPVMDHGAAATAGAQYYYLTHIGPHPLLGYIAALEFRPAPLEEVAALETALGKAALRTVRHHAEADPGHAEALKREIEAHPEFASAIVYNAHVTAKMVCFYLSERYAQGGA